MKVVLLVVSLLVAGSSGLETPARHNPTDRLSNETYAKGVNRTRPKRDMRDKIAKGFRDGVNKIPGSVFSFIGSLALKELETLIMGNKLDDIANQLNEIQSQIQDIDNTLNLIHVQVQQMRLYEQLDFERQIKIIADQVKNNLCYMLPSTSCTNSEIREHIHETVLDPNLGVLHWLYELKSNVLGDRSSMLHPSVVQVMYDYLMTGKDMDTFEPDEEVAVKMKEFITYIRHVFQLGVNVWQIAVTSKWSGNARQDLEHKSWLQSESRRLGRALDRFVDEDLLRPCPTLTPPAEEGIRGFNCTDGNKFGSVCALVCRPAMADYGPVQCLSNGAWSTNIVGQRKFMCTWLASRSKLGRYGCQYKRIYKTCTKENEGICKDGVCNTLSNEGYYCYDHYDGGKWGLCSSTTYPGHTHTGLKCRSTCLNYPLGSWCYTDSSRHWDYCMAHAETPRTIGKTVFGEDCTRPECESLLARLRGSTYCYTKDGSPSWDYCVDSERYVYLERNCSPFWPRKRPIGCAQFLFPHDNTCYEDD